MKALTFIAITLISGAIAGTILGIINQGIVEPYIEQAIAIEVQNAKSQGEMIDPIQFNNYRIWQRGGEIFAGTIIGVSFGALFGIVFAYTRPSLPGSSNKKKALVLAGLMCIVLFIVPALKYPANPPAVGDPETIMLRQSLYVGFLAVSALSALGLAYASRVMGKVRNKNAILPAIYAVVMIAAFFAMPPNPDEITAPMDLVTGFRIASAFTMGIFWGLTGIIFGSFWDKLKPHETSEIRTT